MSASYPRAEDLVAQSWIHPSKTRPFLPGSFSPSSPVARPDSQIHGLGHHLSNFSFQIPCGSRKVHKKKFSVSCSVSKSHVSSNFLRVIFQGSSIIQIDGALALLR